MKKTIFFVSALVVLAMSAMFVACESNTPTNGCVCTVTWQGISETHRISIAEMNEYGYKTCSDIVDEFYREVPDNGEKVSCKGY